MKTITRNKNGNIEMIWIFANTYLSKKDADIFYSHTISYDEVCSFFGDDDSESLKDIIQRLLNNDLTIEEFKILILEHNELINPQYDN